MKRLLLAVVIFALCLIAPVFAHADSFNSTNVVGTVTPGAPANPANVAAYINNMISLSLGGSDTFVQGPHTQTITRSTNPFGSLPTAVSSGAVTGTGTTINLGLGGAFTYLWAKYDAGNDQSFVWNISKESGTITIPANGPMGHGLSGWTLFGPGTPVPDEPSSLMLLGISALGFFVPIRRKLMPRWK